MNNLWHNPVADLDGLSFVVLFAAVGIAGLIVGGFWIWLCDTTRDQDLPDTAPNQLDPYQIAYLRGSASAVAHLAVVDLLDRGLLERHKPANWLGLIPQRMRLRRTQAAVSSPELTSVQRAVWEWFSVARLPREVLHAKTGLVPVIEPLCASYVRSLEQRQLLETAGHKAARRLVGWTMSFSILGLGFYKLAVALITQRHELFLPFVMMVAGLIATIIVCRRTRLSNLGRRLLEFVQLDFEPLAGEAAADNRHPVAPRSPSWRLLGVALFGRPSLTDVLERDFARTPQQAECLVDSDDDTENGSGAESLAVTNEAAR